MKKGKRTWRQVITLAVVCLILGAVMPAAAKAGGGETAGAAAKKNQVTVYIGKTRKLTAAAPKNVISWKSSAPEIVYVSPRGSVKGVSAGKAKVTARLKGGKKELWYVTCESYKESKGSITVFTPEGKRSYKKYKMRGAGDKFLTQRGCSVVGTAIAASGYGSVYSPKQIHNGGAKEKYSELYAANQLKAGGLKRAGLVPGMKVCAKIMENMGIRTVYRETFTMKKAIAEISAHAKAGNAVMFMCNKKTYKGVRVSNSLHTMILIAIDSDGKGVFVDPYSGGINTSHVKSSKKQFSFTVEEFVRAFVEPKNGNRNYSVIGGYVLVG